MIDKDKLLDEYKDDRIKSSEDLKSSDDSKRISVAIIGAGPAGIACAIQLKRQGIIPLVFEKNKIGGLLLNANLVENYPGFSDGISGIDLCQIFEKHFKKLGLEIIQQEVLSLKYINDKMSIVTTDMTKTVKNLYEVDCAIVASGTKPIKPQNLLIDFKTESKVKYEIESIIDVQDKIIAIVGSGDAAFDYALSMSKKNKVIILNRSNDYKCLDLLYERAILNSNINILNNISILSIDYFDEKLKIHLSDNSILKLNYLVFAIGRKPNIDFFDASSMKILDYLIKMKKLFFIGDVVNSQYRQTAISIGDGIRTAMELAKSLKG